MSRVSIAQPDVTLLLDLDGVIREVTVTGTIPGETSDNWLGRPWEQTVSDAGAERIRQMIDDARATGISAFRQVNQRFPNGLELPMEYTTVLLGGRAGLLAIGKNLQAVAELQSRLIMAQQSIERDYWKLRDVETRYRVLFDSSQEPTLLLRAANLRVVDANPAAMAQLEMTRKGGELEGQEFLSEVAAPDRATLQAMLAVVRESGKAPGIRIHLGQQARSWLVRASLMTSEPGPMFILQFTPTDKTAAKSARANSTAFERVVEHVPDGFLVLDKEGVILHANNAFLEMAQVGSRSAAIGERLGRWLSRPGADAQVLLANVRRYNSVRLFATSLNSELGSESEVEISAAGVNEDGEDYIGVIIRDVTRRLRATVEGDHLRTALGSVSEQIGRTSLRKMVKNTVSVVERHYVTAALELAGGNRTAAAELLGLSRQSLYAKLDRYGLENDTGKNPEKID